MQRRDGVGVLEMKGKTRYTFPLFFFSLFLTCTISATSFPLTPPCVLLVAGSTGALGATVVCGPTSTKISGGVVTSGGGRWM